MRPEESQGVSHVVENQELGGIFKEEEYPKEYTKSPGRKYRIVQDRIRGLV
jgi:hypothetical protein